MVYRFGRFVLNRDTRQLLRDGEEAHLTPKAFDLLEVLVANHLRALSKAELQQLVWPSTFVEETNLATLVAEIRRVLGDTATKPAFIRTVYGFGYRFVGVVDGDAAAASLGRSIGLWLMWESHRLPLMEGATVIGRAPDAAIRIDSPGISRYHARVIVTHGQQATLEDLNSKNGTRLNGKPIMRAQLAGGDEIRIGAIALTFLTQSTLNPTETLPPGKH